MESERGVPSPASAASGRVRADVRPTGADGLCVLAVKLGPSHEGGRDSVQEGEECAYAAGVEPQRDDEPYASSLNPDTPQPRSAGFGIRAIARLLDTVATTVVGTIASAGTVLVFWLAGLHLTFAGKFALAPTLVLFSVSLAGDVVYHTVCEWHGGATLGKAILGLRVRNEDFETCSFRGALVRTLAYFVDALFFGLVAYTAMSKSPGRQRYGDRWGHTVVVHASSLPRETRQGGRVAVWVTTGLALFAMFTTIGVILSSVARDAADRAIDASEVALSNARTMPNGLMSVHCPDDFTVQQGSDSSLVVSRVLGTEGSEGVVFVAVKTPVSSDVRKLAQTVIEAAKGDILSARGTLTASEPHPGTCFGNHAGLEVSGSHRVAGGWRFEDRWCVFVDRGHGYVVRSFVPLRRAGRDLALLERVVAATKVLGDP
jgi:uncharacterized RDD family membrane protein YckC